MNGRENVSSGVLKIPTVVHGLPAAAFTAFTCSQYGGTLCDTKSSTWLTYAHDGHKMGLLIKNALARVSFRVVTVGCSAAGPGIFVPPAGPSTFHLPLAVAAVRRQLSITRDAVKEGPDDPIMSGAPRRTTPLGGRAMP